MPRARALDPARVLFWCAAWVTTTALAFGAGMYSAISQNALYNGIRQIKQSLDVVTAERANLTGLGGPVHFLQPSRHDGQGVTVNDAGADPDSLILISGFFDGKNGLRLIRRDGSLVADWPVQFSEHFPDSDHLNEPPQTDWNVDIHGALLMPDGSVVFNYEYAGMVRLDPCGAVAWTLPLPTHHSLERAQTGGFWVPATFGLAPPSEGPAANVYPPFTEKPGWGFYGDDHILNVSDDGQVLADRSVTQILYDSGLEPVLTATGANFKPSGNWDNELVHLNKIAELPAAIAPAFPMFKAGDLLISLRQYNLVAVVDPHTWRVEWHQIGPWRRQHDPEFLADGRIAVFNNNAYRTWLAENDRQMPDLPQRSEIIAVDPATGETSVIYGNRAGQGFLTVIRGKHQPLPGGNTLITEFAAGRAFEVDASGRTVWEFINRYDSEFVLEITEAQAYAPDYVQGTPWVCQ